MKQVRLDIIERLTDEEGPITLGTVLVPANQVDQAKKAAVDLWDRFQDGQPNSDSDYIVFLMGKRPRLFLAEATPNDQVFVGWGG